MVTSNRIVAVLVLAASLGPAAAKGKIAWWLNNLLINHPKGTPSYGKPYWEGIARQREHFPEELYAMRDKYTDKDGNMTKEQREAYVAKFRSMTMTPEEIALDKRAVGQYGAYHYLGSAKFFAQAGKAFAEAVVEMGKK